MFLIKHAQRLERFHNLLFGLCHLEGTPSIRKRCENRLAAKVPIPPWIRATTQWMPAPDDELLDRVEVGASYDFPAASACGLAPAPGIAFIVERLGQVGRVDVRQGRRLEPGLDVRRERPLQMACSGNGRHVAIAFESGVIDVLQTEPEAVGLPSGRQAWTARCRLPDYEAPALEFLDNELWRQDETGDAVASDAASGAEMRRLAPPAGFAGAELAALSRLKDVLVLAWRGSGGLRLITVVDSGGKRQDAQTEAQDINAMVAWGEDAVAVAFSDSRLRIYAVRPALQLRQEIRLDAPAACLAASDSRLWWVSKDGELCSLSPPAARAGRVLSPGRTFVGSRSIALSSNEEGLILTSHSAVSFRRSGSARRGAVIQAVSLRPAGYVAVATTRGQYLVIDGAGQRTMMLSAGGRSGPVKARADGREVGYLFAADSEGRTLVGHDDVCELVDPSTDARVACKLPEGVITAAGSAGGGFWLADVKGSVFALDRRGGCREAARASADLLGPPRLSAWGSLVVWTGTHVAAKAVLAPDPVYLQVFFRATGGRLQRLGSREYAAADGILQAVAWDEACGRLIGIWQGRGNGAARAKIGTLDEFMAGREQEVPMPDLAANCESAAMGKNPRRLFVLTGDGAIRCFDADTLNAVTALAGSIPFTGLAECVPAGRHVAAVAGREQVLLLNSEEGG